MRRNIKLVVSYDGTDFAGWQVQKGCRTVQKLIEEALSDLHGHSVSLKGAGRTDSGVHATGQVANFYTTKLQIPAQQFKQAVNARLPGDVRILQSSEVPLAFHSRYNATSRHYEYRIINEASSVPAHIARYCWPLRQIPSLGVLNRIASAVWGTHNFNAFAVARDKSQSRIRHIHYAVFHSHGAEIVFHINGNAFLWRMVRSILGTVMDIGRKGGDLEQMRSILESGDRSAAGPTAPPRGLFLIGVEYENETGASRTEGDTS